MYSVIITNRYMKDFVTSHMAEMIFNTKPECEKYIISSESFHPGRFFYRIVENKDNILSGTGHLPDTDA